MQQKHRNIDRRRFVEMLGFFGMAALIAGETTQSVRSAKIDQILYIGTYTTGTTSEGIYVYRLDVRSGKLTEQRVVTGVTDPSFLTIDSRRRCLYAVNETDEFNGMKSGAVSAFSIDHKTSDLTFLNKEPSMGGSPCYISVSRNDRFVLVANYVGGNLAVLPVNSEGRLSPAVETMQQQGSGPNNERQASAHAHWVDFDRSGRVVAACDLGADKVFLYRFDDRTGKLTPDPAQAFFLTKPGAGPRHFVFHPNGRFAYVINELDATITALSFDPGRGALSKIDSVSTLPTGWTGENTCAEIQISPDGRFLYGSNRGHDSIVSYSVDPVTGRLSFIEHTSTGGKGPRNFVIDPTGRLLLVANQRSDNIVIFAVDRNTGKLHLTGNTFPVPSPVCLKLVPSNV